MTKDELIENIIFVIENSYILFKGKLYRQIIGIPMGINCAPYLANIFLHVFEHDYIHGLIEANDFGTARKFLGLFRYQDDCIVFDDESNLKAI